MTMYEHTAVTVAIVADTHGWLDARVAALAARCDFAVHAGDIGALRVLQELHPRRGVVLAVRGNNDVPEKWHAGERDVLGELPSEATLELPGGRLHVLHGDRAGAPRGLHERMRRRYQEEWAVVSGHSHRLCCDLEALPWILNPGAAGRQRTRGGPSCLLLHASRDAWQVEARRFAPR
jgi:uncharacterized protein